MSFTCIRYNILHAELKFTYLISHRYTISAIGNFYYVQCDQGYHIKKQYGKARLAKRREILIFPRTAGNTGNSRELLVIPGNYWEISYSLTKKLLIYLLTAIQLYLQCKSNHYNSTFHQIIK